MSQSVIKMIPLYISEGATEGIRGDVAFAQSCLETGNFTFSGSAVTLDQNNFCGMGVTANGMKGSSFKTPKEGIRAQIQHLKAYASADALMQPCADPRFQYVERGCAEYVEWLGIQENPKRKGWAFGAGYGEKILAILNSFIGMEPVSGADFDNDASGFPVPYQVKVTAEDLNIRTGPGTNYSETNEFTGAGVFTIVEVKAGVGSLSGWGRLKSGAGWISLDFARKVYIS